MKGSLDAPAEKTGEREKEGLREEGCVVIRMRMFCDVE